MAEVFAAKLYGADGFEKDLVIKQILPQYARDPEFVQSFVAEAKIAVSLTHANIVSIYELGRVEGTYFIAMEYVDGQDVFALLDTARRQQDPLDTGLALLIVEEVCRGLDYAHRRTGPDGLPLGLVHRDLNPRNILVSREGDVKILDFGIAKTGHKSAAMPKTRAGVVKGTTGYMSPEQATGQTVDHRTDIYQAGLLLFESLTGQALFWRPEDQATRELMRRHHVPAPSDLVSGITREIDQVAIKALKVRPDARYQSAAELAATIARIRALNFPYATPRVLGNWVIRLTERDRAAARAREEAIPATADFSEVISQAIEQSIVGKTEFIASKTPLEGMFQTLNRPQTGSQPLEAHSITGDLMSSYPPSMLSIPSGLESQTLDDTLTLSQTQPPRYPIPTTSEAPNSPQPRSSPYRSLLRGLSHGVVVFIVATLVALPWYFEAQRIQKQTHPDYETSTLTPRGVADQTPSAQLSDAPPIGQPSQAASADILSEPCTGRVVINGQPLPKKTPILEYPLMPGTYRLVFISEACPRGEPETPHLTTTIVVGGGTRLKITGNFELGQISVQ